MKFLDKPVISVIVPVYNVENFLEDCIYSIVNQTYSALEIILVDDGSSDSSGLICDEYAKRDSRIKVIHQANAGVSAARNAGLEEATGVFISFVDADDMIHENTYTSLFNAMKGQADLSIGRSQKITEDGKILGSSINFSCTVIPKEVFLKDLFEEKRFGYLGYLWDKLYRRQIIVDNDIKFNLDVKLNEDRLFILKYILCGQDIASTNDVIYSYRQRNAGAIMYTRSNPTVTDDEMTVLNSFDEMENICREYSKDLLYSCGRKAFESALDLLNRVSKTDVAKQKRLRDFLRKNSIICLKNPKYGLVEKGKIIAHMILKR